MRVFIVVVYGVFVFKVLNNASNLICSIFFTVFQYQLEASKHHEAKEKEAKVAEAKEAVRIVSSIRYFTNDFADLKKPLCNINALSCLRLPKIV